MQVELNPQDANFLRGHLVRYLKGMEDELVHTERREMQQAIAEDARRLRALIEKVFP